MHTLWGYGSGGMGLVRIPASMTDIGGYIHAGNLFMLGSISSGLISPGGALLLIRRRRLTAAT